MAWWSRIANERFHWPEHVAKKRVQVRVDGGAFRDGSVQYVAEERIAAGAPRSLKVLSFVALLFGQAWPIAAFSACIAVFTALIDIGDGSATVRVINAIAIALIMVFWAFASRHAWTGSTALLEGEVFKARTHVSRSIAGYGGMALLGALVVAFAKLTQYVDPIAALVAIGAPLALTCVALGQFVIFEKRADGLLEAQGHARFSPLMAATVTDIRADTSEVDAEVAPLVPSEFAHDAHDARDPRGEKG
ncbi:MAG: hypothetical protein JNK05_39070 [Myxococcales bacterium]|nr:hypothetical protein [Myxococcales bacterium]